MRTLAAAIPIVLVAMAPARARAGGTVLLVPVASAEADVATELTEVVRITLQDAGAKVIVAEASLADMGILAGCEATTPTCQQTIASTMEVNRIVLATLDNGVLTMKSVPTAGEPTVRRFRLPNPTAQAFAPIAAAFLQDQKSPAEILEPPIAPEPPFEPPPRTAAPPTVVAAPEQPRAGLGAIRAYSWGLAGGGVATTIVGAVLLAKAGSKQDEVDAAATDVPADFDRLVELENDGRRLTTWGNVLTVTGGLAAAVGIGIGVHQASSRTRSRTAATVAPLPLRGGRGVAVGWEW